MSIKEENVCRLCLNIVESEFEMIDEITREMFDVLLLKVNLEISKNPIMCQQCAEIVKKSYYFKSLCIDTEKNILSVAVNEPKVKFEFKNIFFRDYEDVETIVDEDFNTCRFCMNQREENNSVSIDILTNEAMFVNMLPVFMPEIDWNITKKTVVCTLCRENLECYFKFLLNCLDVEEKINTYCQNDEGTHVMSQVQLSDIHFLYKTIKQEAIFGTAENIQSEMYEELNVELADIKHEEASFDASLFISPSENIMEQNPDKYPRKKSDWKQDPTQMYKCALCTYETKRKYSLKSHMLIHNGQVYKCTLCPYETRRKCSLKSHTLKHRCYTDVTEIKMYKCAKCSYASVYKQNLYLHSLIHKKTSEVEMHKCTTCIYETKRKDSLLEHIRLIHSDPSQLKMYKCTICTYESKRRRHLKRHMVVHMGKSEVEMYKCALCTYETKHKYCLKIHIHRMHKKFSKVKK